MAFDEAGNTGDNLLDPAQPIFALASVEIDAGMAASLLPADGRELHFKSARRSERGRAAILKVLSSEVLTEASVRALVVHKPFTVVAKMVDVLVEPLAAADGVDLQADGAHRALSNLLFAVLPAMASEASATALYSAFVEMIRKPSASSAARFRARAADVGVEAQGRLDREVAMLSEGARLGAFGGGGLPDLDPGPTCLVTLAHAWASDGQAFSVLHDERPELSDWKSVLEPLWSTSATPMTFTAYNGQQFTYPLPIRSLSSVPSHEDPRVQVADVIAGAIVLVVLDILSDAPDPTFAATLRSQTSVLDWVIDAVWPTLDMDPQSLGVVPGSTPFIADAMADWTLSF